MPTSFRILQTNGASLDIDLALFQQALPEDMLIESRGGETYVSVLCAHSEDETAQFRIDRELDRLYFLTGVRIRAEMCRKTVTADSSCSYSIHGRLAPTIKPQKWSYNLTLQLRLWSVATQSGDPLTRILLFFQVIELSYPSPAHYPPYLDSRDPPDRRTECRLLRHLVAHSGEVDKNQLKNYCEYLGLPPLMLDRTDPDYVELLSSKAPLVALEAKEVIASAL
ncbi:MAG: hypothetical protein ACYCVW_02565 [Rhodocyclaceae bacterium]